MDNKLINYLPLIGIIVTIGFLMFTFMKGGNKLNQTPPLDNVIKNINSTASNPNVNNSVKGPQTMDKTKMTPPANKVVDSNKTYFALFKTSKGDMKFKLYTTTTVNTANNFVYLAKSGFYDGLKFHRVIKGFMIQGGDPLGNGTGGPGYKFNDEVSDKKLVKGSLAMANAGPNTNGSQFFIVSAASTPYLDGKHTNFGELVEGLNVLDTIQAVKTDMNDKPVEDVIINSVQIIEQ